MYPQDADDVQDLLRHVDQAMYAAKSQGATARHYSQGAQPRARQVREVVQALPTALDGGQFFLLYQPVYALQGGALLKAEALLRWSHPTLGVLRPMEFLPYAEDHALLCRIGDWVLDRVVQDMAAWQGAGQTPVQVILNVSVAQLETDDGCAARWLQQIRAVGLEPQAFAVELSERSVSNLGPQARANLAALRDAGVGLGVTGFGPETSSLSAVGRRSADYFKLHGATLGQILEDEKAWQVCEAIVQLAHKLDVPVLAQGVASQAQHDSLRRLGCQAAQGYWYDEPLDAQTFLDRLARGRWEAAPT